MSVNYIVTIFISLIVGWVLGLDKQRLYTTYSIPQQRQRHLEDDHHNSDDLQQQYETYVAICVAAKDDGQALAEWVAYHLCIGAGRIYLYDDRSQPPMLEHIQDYVGKGEVVYEYVDIGRPAQLFAYNDCLTKHRSKHKWLVGMDLDEFIVIRGPPVGSSAGAPTAQSLTQVLQPLEMYGAVKMPWIQIGSSNHTTPPDAGVVRSYINCQQKHQPGMTLYVKSIANTKYAAYWFTAHETKFLDPEAYAVDGSKGLPVRKQAMAEDEQYSDTLALFHYAIKSYDDFQRKMLRGGGDGMTRGEFYFKRVNEFATETCYEAAAWGDRCLKDSMRGVAVPQNVSDRLFGRKSSRHSGLSEESGEGW